MKLKFITTVFLVISLVGCNKDSGIDEPITKSSIEIAVITDLHLMDKSLLTLPSKPFDDYMNADPKLLQYSADITQAVVDQLIKQKPDIVLVAGDLTKDGEVVSHKATAELLQKLTDNGIKVYVTPGNHDINSPEAASFHGDVVTPVSSISATDFAQTYVNFGFSNAIARDNASLSYVVEPFKNLRILTIDANKYEENPSQGSHVYSGRVKPQTYEFIEAQLADAKSSGVRVIAMMHHNLIPHWGGQQTMTPGFVVDDYENLVDLLTRNGVQLVITGHEHVQDIVQTKANNTTIYDVTIPSLVSFPAQYSHITITETGAKITSQSVDMNIAGKSLFAASQEFAEKRLGEFVRIRLGLPDALAAIITPVSTPALMTYYAGDEVLTAEIAAQIEQVCQIVASFDPESAELFKMMLYGLYTDLPPADRNFQINF